MGWFGLAGEIFAFVLCHSGVLPLPFLYTLFVIPVKTSEVFLQKQNVSVKTRIQENNK
ncbi:MAG: hypothetical protein LBG21_06770 [Campylobacteraceae bacterium]|jgi:hypothetical protein|nr:hypothetical protein [Campylobacteraceae bacterium]